MKDHRANIENHRKRQYAIAAAEMRRLAQCATLACVEAPTAINHLHATMTHKRAAFCFRQLDAAHPSIEEHAAQAAVHARSFLEVQ